MKAYAVLNENNICIGVSQLSGEVVQPNMIEIPTVDTEYLWKKYENNQWSTEKFEPVSTAPLSDYEQLKSQMTEMQIAINMALGL